MLVFGLLVKHYVADFLLQFPWMISQKGSLAKIGGYMHAGFHAIGTILCFWLLGINAAMIVTMAVAEFFVHFLIDFTKAKTSDHISSDTRPRMYWGLYGLDQLAHHLTYLVMVYVVINYST